MKYVKYREYCDVMVNRVIYYFIAIPILNIYPVAITYLLSLYYMENTQLCRCFQSGIPVNIRHRF